jgi:hypothetical protein
VHVQAVYPHQLGSVLDEELVELAMAVEGLEITAGALQVEKERYLGDTNAKLVTKPVKRKGKQHRTKENYQQAKLEIQRLQNRRTPKHNEPWSQGNSPGLARRTRSSRSRNSRPVVARSKRPGLKQLFRRSRTFFLMSHSTNTDTYIYI